MIILISDVHVPCELGELVCIILYDIHVCLPDESNTILLGPFNVADVAAPLSPLKLPLVLLPAIVVMIPVDTITLRIRWLYVSAMYTLPNMIKKVNKYTSLYGFN